MRFTGLRRGAAAPLRLGCSGMMKIIGWMLIRMVAIRYLAILLGISFFVLSLDLLVQRQGRAGAAAGRFRHPARLHGPPRALGHLELHGHQHPAGHAAVADRTQLPQRDGGDLGGGPFARCGFSCMLLPLAFLAGGLQFVLSDIGHSRHHAAAARLGHRRLWRRQAEGRREGPDLDARRARHPARGLRQCRTRPNSRT